MPILSIKHRGLQLIYSWISVLRDIDRLLGACIVHQSSGIFVFEKKNIHHVEISDATTEMQCKEDSCKKKEELVHRMKPDHQRDENDVERYLDQHRHEIELQDND